MTRDRNSIAVIKLQQWLCYLLPTEQFSRGPISVKCPRSYTENENSDLFLTVYVIVLRKFQVLTTLPHQVHTQLQRG